MSLLSSFITNHLLQTLESEFVNHELEMQAVFLEEAKACTDKIIEWLNSKVQPKAE